MTDLLQSQRMPRGLRNNNPLNLRKSSNKWLGKIYNGTDPAFEQFTSLEMGIRAGMINARTIAHRQKPNNTLEALIHTWAPSSDNNDTAAYVRAVSFKAGLHPDYIVDYRDSQKFCALIRAMIYVECDVLLEQSIINTAYDLAFSTTEKSPI